VLLRKAQEKIKQQIDRKRKEVEEWKKENRVMLSIKDLVFKERPARKLVDQYIILYLIKEIVFINTVKLQLSTSMKIYLVVNISQIVWYKEQVEEQKVKEVKPVEVQEVKEQKVEKILKEKK